MIQSSGIIKQPVHRIMKRSRQVKRFRATGLLVCLLLLFSFADAQIKIAGTVTGQNSEPVAGASISQKGSSVGTVTDTNGRFELSVPKGSILTATYVGYLPQDIQVGTEDKTDYIIQLRINKNELDEIVVVGYGTRKKSDVTGAITTINEQSIKDVPASNLAAALQGQGAGIDIQRGGSNSKPGSTPSILIRGARSLGASNSPLIVVDGIPFNGSINDLNQDDVASVDILKDASATAIYGSRGANGVILISTKRGRVQDAVVTYSGYAGRTTITRSFPVMNASQFALLKKWANINAYPGKYTGLDDPDFLTNGVFDPAEVEGLKTGRSTDWQNLLYKHGLLTNHQVGVTGGTEKTQYAASLGYFNQTGIYPGQGFQRFTVKLSLDQQLGRNIKVGLSSLNTFTIRDGENANPMGQALRASPLASPFDSTGAIVNNFVPGSAAQVWNPLADFVDGQIVEVRKRFGTFTTLYFEAQLADGLKYRMNAGAEIRSDIYGRFSGSNTTVNMGGASKSVNSTGFGTDYTLDNILTYDKTFGSHTINFTGLFGFQESNNQSNSFDNTDISADYLAYFNPAYGANLTGSGSYSKWDILSYMGRLNYSFKDKYLLTLTMRSDGSSRLAPGNKYHVFPGVAAGWNITKEPFWNPDGFISNLKLRASYATVGNTAISPYQTLGGLSSLPYNFGSDNVTGAFPTSVPNPDLTWEYTSTANIGLDFAMLQNRISGSLEVYKEFTNSLLLPETLPPTSGIPNAVLTNIGKTQNKGIELQISSVNVKSSNPMGFSWSTDLNLSINRGRVVQLAAGITSDVSNGWFVGHPIDVFYDYKKLGIWQNTPGDSALARSLGLTLNGTSSVIGTIKVGDISGPDGKPDGKIDATYDRMIIGTSQPKWQGGMTNRFGFKGFDLTVVAFARMGNMMYSGLEGGGFVNTYQGTYNNLVQDFWTPENHQQQFPKANAGSTNPAYHSLLGYFDGSFIKIRSLSLGYNLSPATVQKLGLRSLRVYATASDPFILFSPYRRAGGIDPEGAGNLGTDTPSVWSMLFGINVSF